MTRGDKLLDGCAPIPPRDWRIEDVERLCAAFDLSFERPPGESHYGISAPGQRLHVTIPFKRSIKPVYIRQLVRFIDAVTAAREEG